MITVQVAGYEATVSEYGKVTISRAGVWAGAGAWHEETQTIVDCPAILGEDVYDALDAAIAAALTEVQ